MRIVTESFSIHYLVSIMFGLIVMALGGFMGSKVAPNIGLPVGVGLVLTPFVTYITIAGASIVGGAVLAASFMLLFAVSYRLGRRGQSWI